MRTCISMVLLSVAVADLAMPVSGQGVWNRTTTVELSNAHAARLPYMAEFKILRIQTLANGITITRKSTLITARDSQVRRMTATTAIPTSADQTATTHFQVFDPVAHVTFNWGFPGREATVMAIPFSGAIPPSCGFMVGRIFSASEKTTVEDLGTMAILGVEARGRRTTTTIPIESIRKHKSHKPLVSTAELVSTTELWQAIAPGLTGLVVREVSEDAQSGKMSKEMVKFSQDEPDAAFFRPPKGYEIVNREVDADPCVSFGEMESPVAPTPVLP